MTANIKPEIIRRITDYFYSLLKESLDQLRKIQASLVGNPSQNLPFKDVDPHADRVGERWFFDISSQAMGMIRFHDPQFQWDFLLSHSDRDHSLMPAMISDQLFIIESGKDISIHDQKGLRKIWDDGKRTGRSKSLLFFRITNRDSVLAPISKISREERL